MMGRRGSRKRKIGGSMAVVEEGERAMAQKARLEALEDGVDQDAMKEEDDDEEFKIVDELEADVAAKGKAAKKHSKGHKRKKSAVHSGPSSFAVLLEESGVYEGKVPEPHYLSAEAARPSIPARRLFCQICGNFAKYRCGRCYETYCSVRCNNAHNELRCIKATL